MTQRELLDYEIRSSWWACLISSCWAQELAGRYFAWKVDRKYSRYVASMELRARLRREYPEIVSK